MNKIFSISFKQQEKLNPLLSYFGEALVLGDDKKFMRNVIQVAPLFVQMFKEKIYEFSFPEQKSRL